MAGNIARDTISIGIEYHLDGNLGVATFRNYDQPIMDTYAITPDRFVAFMFDSHWAGRLDSIIVSQSGAAEAEAILIPYLGAELTSYLTHTKQVGLFVTTAVLTIEQRITLTRLQAESPASPPIIRKVSTAQLQQLRHDIIPSVEYI
ncbi:MAG: hypothetical protein JWM37_336 [Candidatus Saccharibacteria bacterium]|nr:hypothetical protein [Candidatus Saccharibacteria bacterium]